MKVSKIWHHWYGSGGGAPAPFTATLGTTVDPATQGANLFTSSAGTLFDSDRLPVSSTLKQIKVFCPAGGTLKLKKAVPVKGAGFTVTDLQTLTVSIGLNTFSVAGGTLTEQTIEANSLVGFVLSGGATVSFLLADNLSAGYFQNAGDISGTLRSISGQNYSGQLQFQWQGEYQPGQVHPDYIIDENFASAVAPAYVTNSAGWTFPGGGIAVNAGSGGVVDHYDVLGTDRRYQQIEFNPQNLLGTFTISFIDPFVSSRSLQGRIDIAGSTMQFFYGATPTAFGSATALSGITLSTGKWFRLRLEKAGILGTLLTLTLTDTVTLVSQSITITAGDVSGSIYGFGVNRIACASSFQVQIRTWQAAHTETQPIVTIHGDSITEGYFASTDNGYAQLVLDRLGGEGWISGNSAQFAQGICRYLRHVLNRALVPYVIVYAGTNLDTIPTWETHIQNINAEIVNRGLTAIFVHMGFHTTGSTNTNYTTLNTYLSANFPNIVRTRIAMSVGGDGVTRDAAKYTDALHPNTSGHSAMDVQVATDAPQIFV